MNESETTKFSELTPERLAILNENWVGAQNMLAHLMSLHIEGPQAPHPAVMTDIEIEQMKLLDYDSMSIVLRSAVIALAGASAFALSVMGDQGMEEFLKQHGQE